jgi:hypothetical protein
MKHSCVTVSLRLVRPHTIYLCVRALLFKLIKPQFIIRLVRVLRYHLTSIQRSPRWDHPYLGRSHQKVCLQRIDFISELLTQGLKCCLNNCFTLGNSPPKARQVALVLSVCIYFPSYMPTVNILVILKGSTRYLRGGGGDDCIVG